MPQYGPGSPRDFQPVRDRGVVVVTASIIAVPLYRPRSSPVDELLRRGSWRIAGPGGVRRPARIGRRSKGWHWRYKPWGDPILEHLVYLDLGRPLAAGGRFVVRGPCSPRPFIFRGDRHPARAVKANQVGYVAGSTRKFAYLGEWMGTLGALRLGMQGKPFLLVDARTGRIRFRGTAVRRDGADRASEHGQELYSLDFSGFTEEGQFVVCVPGVGASHPFRIGDDAYSGVFRTVMRAIYHQRCGTALDRRHTRFIHGECHRQQVVASGLRFGEEGQDGVFRELPKRATGEVLKDAWGGYHDAGDYDRHTCHMTVPYRLLEVYEAFPRKFHDNQLGIPESRNGNPDIVDEARWGIDVFRRLQDRRDGGVHGGIETFEHPNFGVAPDSAVERTIPLWAFAKDGASSLFFAAVTARACRVYRMIGRRRDANLMLRCATRAWRYGLGEYPRLKAVCHWDLPYRREDVVALAAAELYRTTGRDAYHRAFLSRYRLRKHPGIVIHKSWHDRCLALVASVYLGTPYARDRKAVAASAGALREYAEESIRWTERLGYRVARAPDAFRGWGSLTGQSWHEPLLRAAIAFGGHEARRYRDWAGHVADTWLGGNPAGMSWLTGVGARHVNNPLHIPSLNDGIPEPVPGIPFYGPIARRAADKWSATALGTMTPPASRTPDPLCFTDMNIFASMTEFTVWQCHAPCAALFGWLAPDTGERGRGRG